MKEKQYNRVWITSGTAVLILTLLILPQINKNVSAQSLGEVGVCIWRGCKKAAASFTIDDAHPICGTEMENAGFRGTYYLPGDPTPETILGLFSDIKNAGHELASHTVSHQCDIPACFPTCTPESLADLPYNVEQVNTYRLFQIEPNISRIEEFTEKPVISMAWPCGNTDAGKMAAMSSYFLGSRGEFRQDLNNFTWIQSPEDKTPDDYTNLKSGHYYTITSYGPFLDETIAEGKWAILITHSDCTPVNYLKARGDSLWLAPVGEVLKYIKVRDATHFSNYSHDENGIRFDVQHNLEIFQRQKLDGSYFLPVIYDNPVTIQVRLLDMESVSSVQANDSPVDFSIRSINNNRYLLFDLPLNVMQSVVVDITVIEPILRVENSSVTYNSHPQTADVVVDQTSPITGTIDNIQYWQDGTLLAGPPENTGTYALRVEFTPAGHQYPVNIWAGNFVIKKAKPAPTLTIANPSVTYNGQGHAATVQVSGPITGSVDNIQYLQAGTRLESLPVIAGTYTVMVDFTPGGEYEANYERLIGASAGSFLINEASPALEIKRTAAEMTFSRVGEVIHYSYVLTNIGDVTLDGPFTIEDDQVKVACTSTSSLAPEANLTCTASYTIMAEDIQAGKVENTATGFGSYAGEKVVSNTVKLTVRYQANRLYIPLISSIR